MKGHTQRGLFLLMISQILAMVTVISMFFIWFSVTPATLSSDNFTFSLFLIPLGIIGVIAGLIALIGGIFFLMGSKEFGESHKKFVFYAVIIFIIYIVAMIIVTMFTTFLTFSVVSQSFFTQNTSLNIESLSQILSMALITSPLMAIVSGLIWVFGLYHLENEKGRLILLSGYVCMIAVAVVTSISSFFLLNDWVNAGYFENIFNTSSGSASPYSHLLSSSQWLGTTGIISVIGLLIQNTLYFFSLYIPYQRIASGDLVPVPSPSDIFLKTGGVDTGRRCTNCGRAIPFDANVCPYCGKKF